MQSVDPPGVDDEFEKFILDKLDTEALRECARLNWYREYEPVVDLHDMPVEDTDRTFCVLREYEAAKKVAAGVA